MTFVPMWRNMCQHLSTAIKTGLSI
ncbi:hypothetical protein MAR_030991 [Mya arenaria]|uniref:Uncharacterized protein n=1 Tax=Mya arenaria TaxID=6604 RepID=A0ABY7F451_MYAAR|nr:hypothetical protein MAR_030991 [Mya arenaria]